MFKFKKILKLAFVITACFSLLTVVAHADSTDYWLNSNDGIGTISPTNGDGNFSAVWTNCGNFIIGKGWAVGSPTRIVHYRINSFTTTGNAYVVFNGWTQNPLTEYYVVETWGTYRPTGVFRGTVISDGGTYDIYSCTMVNQPSIQGTATFNQYWSVRQMKNSIGVDHTITFANHVNAWKKYGLNLGNIWGYQVMGIEGYGSSGSGSIKVW